MIITQHAVMMRKRAEQSARDKARHQQLKAEKAKLATDNVCWPYESHFNLTDTFLLGTDRGNRKCIIPYYCSQENQV
jgi:hypothetical protein